MTRMEELLRTALREDNAEIGPSAIRPLKLDAVKYSRRAGTRRYLAHWRPAFAAVAVLAIVALWLTLSHVPPGSGPPIAPVRPSASATGTAAPATVPAYYAATTAARSPAYSSPQNVTVRDTYSAAVLATARPPAGYGTFAFVTGTGRAGQWIAGAQRWHPHGIDNSAQLVKLFLLSYDAGSRQVTIRPLPPPPMPDPSIAVTHGPASVPTSLVTQALSPDGTRLAIVVATPAGFDVRVYMLASGTVRNWAAPRLDRTPDDWQFSLTWLDDNRTLVIGAGNDSGAKVVSRVWYLDTSAPGGELAAASRTVTLTFPAAKPSTSFSGPHTPAWCSAPPIATTDGQLLLCSGMADFPDNMAGATSAGIWVFSARTGKLTGALEQRTICCAVIGTQFPRLIWASPAGGTLVVTGIADANGGAQLFVRAPDGHHTQIPWAGGIFYIPGIGNPIEPDVAW